MDSDLPANLDLSAVGQWSHWFRALVYLFVGYFLARIATKIGHRLTRDHFSEHQMQLFRRLIFYVILLLFTVSALRELGFQLSVLLGAAGIFSVALGFASQTSASNLISGLFLIGEKPFQVGDLIDIEGTRGVVVSIDLLSVKLRTPDNLFVRVPNESIIKSRVTNVSKFPIRRIDLKIGVAYKENIARVRSLLLKAADENPLCLEEPEPFCVVDSFGESSVDLQFSVWVKREAFRDLKDSLLEDIKEVFDKEGIEIPYPHISLYTGSQTTPMPLTVVKQDISDNQRE